MSEIRANTVSDAAGTGPVTLTKQQAAKHWCYWTQTSTQTIFDSFNTSSITDGGTGYTGVTMTSAMSSTTWAVSVTGTGSTTSGGYAVTDSSNFGGSGTTPYRSTTGYNVRGVTSSGTQIDHPDVSGIAYGVLA